MKITKYLFLPALGLLACQGPEQKVENKVNPGFDYTLLSEEKDPCQDFFGFTADKWQAENPIPASEGRWGNFNILGENTKKKVNGILKEVSQNGTLTKGTDEQLVGDMFFALMDSISIEEKGIAPVAEFLKEIEEIETKEDLVKYWSWLKFKGVATPVGFYVGTDQKDATANILYTYPSGLGLPDKAYYEKTDSTSVFLQNEYRALVNKYFELAGLKDIENPGETVFALEKKMAALNFDRATRRNPDSTYHRISAEKFISNYADLPIQTWFETFEIEPEDVVVTQLRYLKSIGEVIGQASLEDLKTYHYFHVINEYASLLSHDFVQTSFDFYGKNLRGQSEMKPRWNRALGMMGGLQEQIGHLFVDKYFDASSKEMVENMVEDIRTVFGQRIEQLTWMSEETKMKAKEKLAAFTYKIGYPDKWKDYSDLTLTRDDAVENQLNLTTYLVHENLAKLNKPVDKSEWGMGAHVVNAYYNPSYNEIVFPAAILQPPFFDPNGDMAINYGGIGGVIGHEFSHGFDDAGSKYDGEGNLNDWWTAEDRKAFEALGQRLVEQYNAYAPIPGAQVNGQLTLGENIADLGGLTLAHQAYLQSKYNDGTEINGFSGGQRVFLGWAQVWQGNATDNFYRSQVATDPHSPVMFRVNGTIKNVEAFYQDFSCAKPGEDLILIW